MADPNDVFEQDENGNLYSAEYQGDASSPLYSRVGNSFYDRNGELVKALAIDEGGKLVWSELEDAEVESMIQSYKESEEEEEEEESEDEESEDEEIEAEEEEKEEEEEFDSADEYVRTAVC